MAVDANNVTWTYTAAEDQDNTTPGTGMLYKGIALDDRKFAANGEECTGVLVYGAKSGENARIVVSGVTKIVAGGAISAGGAITCAGSGYFTAADSGDYVVGRLLDADVASGAVGTAHISGNPIYLSV